ncbi:hypothetical protein B0F90DRAFT_170641 [Multifurca ochricompacta]|uniref:Uncharacterized protein n=1 Tax=Multifurca ochricompacta TaxID=376703 RepID=A0AAD4QPG5_9AGAM|nr:hypothetical protein B0F90DRAFT_170641 [Multifurca ochricompacta]
METFSWSDTLRALIAPCLACLKSSQSERNDLEDLLADSGSGTTADAETLSLHSNPGTAPRRRRTRFGKSIQLFGWSLFGRPAIRLPDDDEEEEDERTAAEENGQQEQTRRKSNNQHRHQHRPAHPTISSSTLDSDAAPLDSAAIVSHATKHAEEEAARAARRARRRERKEMKRAALALALEHAATLEGGGGNFEGFPGSGGGGRRAPLPSPFGRSLDIGAPHRMGGNGDAMEVNGDDDYDDDEGDFGAGAYVRRAPGSSDSGGRGSDSRSRTSTSLSLSSSGQKLVQSSVQSYNHHYISQQQQYQQQQPTPTTALPLPLPSSKPKKNKLSSRSSGSKTTSSSSKRSVRSSLSAPQSPSLASPVVVQFPEATVPEARPLVAEQEFEGFPSDLGLHTVSIERLSSGFPSPGIGGPRNGKRERDLGAFLANRGDS